jgi:hypothetical protein
VSHHECPEQAERGRIVSRSLQAPSLEPLVLRRVPWEITLCEGLGNHAIQPSRLDGVVILLRLGISN